MTEAFFKFLTQQLSKELLWTITIGIVAAGLVYGTVNAGDWLQARIDKRIEITIGTQLLRVVDTVNRLEKVTDRLENLHLKAVK